MWNLLLERCFWYALQLIDKMIVASCSTIRHLVGTSHRFKHRLLPFGSILATHRFHRFFDRIDNNGAEFFLGADRAA